MLEIDDVQAGYGRSDRAARRVLAVPTDGVAAVLGHNGAGKTTLLRAAIGLLKPARGHGPARRRGHHPAARRTSGWRAAWPTCRRASSASRT